MELEKTCINLKLQGISDEELRLITQVINISSSVKVTLEALCQSDVTLCKAVAALTFMLNDKF